METRLTIVIWLTVIPKEKPFYLVYHVFSVISSMKCSGLFYITIVRTVAKKKTLWTETTAFHGFVLESFFFLFFVLPPWKMWYVKQAETC